ncbi:MAG TPA: hypothetical protein VH593_30545, partial [Ktedonobacteraceae bacterium]
MMNNMMPGSMMDSGMVLWTALGILLLLALIGAAAWLLANWLNVQRTRQRRSAPQPRDSYQEYEQGYQPPLHVPEPYQENELHYAYHPSQDEQPQAQYQHDDVP